MSTGESGESVETEGQEGQEGQEGTEVQRIQGGEGGTDGFTAEEVLLTDFDLEDLTAPWYRVWWERLSWKVEGVWDFFRYDVPYGVRSVWWLLPVVWRFRTWDYRFSYDLLIRALELQALGIKRNKNHTEWRRDVQSICRALDLWFAFAEAPDWDTEDARWKSFHDHLKAHARGWWD